MTPPQNFVYSEASNFGKFNYHNAASDYLISPLFFSYLETSNGRIYYLSKITSKTADMGSIFSRILLEPEANLAQMKIKK